MAVAGVGVALSSVAKSLADFKLYQWLILIAVIMLVISGPSMILAWLKLRKRNLSPLLNANGWAINASVKVNISFGVTLTEVGKAPLKAEPDPFADKTPFWKQLLKWLLILFVIYWTLYTSMALYKITKVEYFNYDAKQKAKQELVQQPVTSPEPNGN